MKVVLVIVLAVATLSAAAPPSKEGAPVQTVRSEFDQQPDGNYHYAFEADNGIKREENGELKQVPDEENKPHNVVVVRGSYSYPDENNKPVVVTYYADETGYHAEGDSIPKTQ